MPGLIAGTMHLHVVARKRQVTLATASPVPPPRVVDRTPPVSGRLLQSGIRPVHLRFVWARKTRTSSTCSRLDRPNRTTQPPAMNESQRHRLARVPQMVLACAGVAVLLLLLIELGFPLTEQQQSLVMLATTVVLWSGAAAEIWRVFVEGNRWTYLRKHWRSATAAVFLMLMLAGKGYGLDVMHRWWPHLTEIRLESFYLGALQLVVLGWLAHRSLEFSRLLAFAEVSPRLILIGSFLALIITGALLLKLPRATTNGSELSWIDSLFTSTSAVCVTGLIVVDTATVFSEFGQIIILGLFQLGGLGLMTFAYFFVTVFRGVTLRDRALLLDLLNEDHFGRITHSLVAIVVMTFAFEAIGAVLLYTFNETNAPGSATWLDSVFHAVSAFCNAGFSTYSLGLFDPLTRSNAPYQVVVMVLIVVGGIGFPVLANMWDHGWSRIRSPRQRPPRLTTHSKTVLVTTGGLLLGGTLLIYVLEYLLRDSEAWIWRPFSSLFLSVTARTAGFNTVPIELLTPATVMVVIFLMFIGGGPASTAGGIKVSTFAIALLNTLRILRHPGGELVAFGRRIPAHLANRAFAIALLAVVWVSVTSLTLMALMPDHAPLDVMFESVSAFATVGLSRGITADVPTAGKLILIVSMIVGRIGILYAAIGVLGRESRGRISYPEATVIIS
jgi:potassium uptake TrkH family protein